MTDLGELRARSAGPIRKAAALAERIGGKPPIVAFSGGKDSQAVYHLAEEAGAPFEAVMNATSTDPPEVIRFVRGEYPAVKIEAPRESFWALCERKGMLPTMRYRFCCAELKESGGTGRVTLTGVRRQESHMRAQPPFQGSPRRVPGVVDFKEERCGVHGLTVAVGRHRLRRRLVDNQIGIWLNDDELLTLGVSTRFEYDISQHYGHRRQDTTDIGPAHGVAPTAPVRRADGRRI